MAKLTLTDLVSNVNFITEMNANLAAIEAFAETCLTRDGVLPNSMSADIDANSNKLINLADPEGNQDAATKSYVSAAIAGSGTVVGVASYTTNTVITLSATDYCGIGEVTPEALLHVKDADSGVTTVPSNTLAIIESDGDAFLTFRTGTTNNAGLLFGDSGDNDIGRLRYVHSQNELQFTVNAIDAFVMNADTSIPSFELWGGASTEMRLKFVEGGTDRGLITYRADVATDRLDFHVGGVASGDQLLSLVDGTGVAVGQFTNPQSLLHVHENSAGAVDIRITNTDTGSAATDGLSIGLNATEQALLWNYENTDMILAVNNTASLTIDNDTGIYTNGATGGSQGAGTINATGLYINGASFLPLVQYKYTSTSVLQSITTVIPFDDTIPQNTEGDEVLTLSITPANANNLLVIEFGAQIGASGSAGCTAALFQDSTAGALAAVSTVETQTNGAEVLSTKYTMVAGTVSATTFKLRMGPTAGTLYINGTGAARRFGGVSNTYLTITEIVQ